LGGLFVKIDYYETQRPPEGKDLGKYIGIEVEFLTEVDWDRMEDELSFAGVHGVQLKVDNSVFDREEAIEGTEFCILSNIDDLSNLEGAIEAIQRLGGWVNPSCGLHIHLDMRHVSLPKARAIGKRMARALPLLRNIVAPYRNESQYCARPISEHEDRYAAINLESLKRHRTIEIRLHQGTLDFTKIKNWIMLLYKLSRAKSVPATASLDRVAKATKLPIPIRNYFSKRIKLMKILRQLEASEVAQWDDAA
jgi:hypothetical protein